MADAPTETIIEPPKVTPTPKGPTAGDKFKDVFAKLEGGKIMDEPTAPKKEEPKVEEKVSEKPEEKSSDKPAEKPASPLDAIIGKDKASDKAAEAPDVLKEFDVQKPNWQRANEVMKTQSGRIKELESELTKVKSEPRTDPNVITLTQERDQLREQVVKYEQNLKAINAEYSEDYQKLVKDRESVLTKIGSRSKAYGADSEVLLDALALPEGKFKTQQIKEAMSDLDPDDRARMHTLIEQLDERDEKILDFKKDLPQKWDEIQARRDVQLREESEQHIKILETQFGKIVDDLPSEVVTLREVPDDVDGAAEWNSGIRSAKERALADLKPNGTDFPRTARIAVQGEHYPELMKYTLNIHSRLTDALSRLREIDESAPDFRGGKKPTMQEKKTPVQKYEETMQKLQTVEE